MAKSIFTQLWHWRLYAIPFIAVAMAFTIKLLLAPFITHESPFLVFFMAVLFSSYYGPKGSGLIATLLSALIADYFFLYPFNSFFIYELGQGIRVILFILEGWAICMAITALKSARNEVEQKRFQIFRQQENLQQMNALLEQKVEERTQQYLTINSLLNQKMAESAETQAALHQSEERLNLALEASGDGIWDWDVISGDVYLSPAWLDMLGYDPEELPGHVSTWETLMHPDDKTWVTEVLKAHLQDSSFPYSFSYRLKAKWGHWKWIDNYGKVFKRDAEGQPLRMVGIHRDINERKLAEEALLESEAKLRSFYDSTDRMIGVIEVIDGETFNHSANKAVTSFLGVTPEEMHGKFYRDLGVPPEMTQLWVHYCQESDRCRQPMTFEFLYPAPKGEIWLSATVNPIGDRSEERSRFSYIVEDVTERKRIRQSLEESEANYRAIVEDQTELICRFQPDGTLMFVNDAYCQYFNKQPDELIGRVFLPLIPPEDRFIVTDNLATITPENPTVICEHRVILPSGEIRWMRWIDRAIFDSTGHLIVLQAVGSDITDRKLAEFKMAESLHEKEVLLKEVHHRVKNNLQVICSLLNLQARSLKNPTMTRHLQEAQNRVRSMAIVHEKLYQSDSFSKIDLKSYVKDLVKYLFRAYIHGPSQIVSKLKIQADIWLDIDTAIPCGLIIQELVSNALKYAFHPNESGEVIIEAKAIANGQVTLSVRDNGQGLPATAIQAEPETLGLRLVYDLTEQINGKLDLDSTNGTCFTISFPVGEGSRESAVGSGEERVNV
jgi:PAS domain S-box-containing protein